MRRNTVTRREFFGTAAAGAAALTIPHTVQAATPEKPNVIFLYSDTHRWGALPFTQTPAVQTPHLEQMLQKGASMDRCYSTLPICSPYRGMLLTGHWPWQQGMMANHMFLGNRIDMPEGQEHRGTLGWMFKDAGYATGYFGKSHWGGNDVRPFGFDKSIVWKGTGNHVRSKYHIDGGEQLIWERGDTDASNCTPTVTQSLEWMDTVQGDTPFFMMISLNPPHAKMFDAPEEKKALYPDEKALPWHPHDERHEFVEHQGYHAHISDVDDEVGRILQQLDTLGITENTIFIYTSDHGGMSGVRGIEYGQKRNPEDESVRVPFLAQWPGKIPVKQRMDTLFSTIDHFPTICHLANLPQHLKDADTAQALDSLKYLEECPGVDLSMNLLAQADAPDPESIFILHASNMNNNNEYMPIFRGVVTKDYTYALKMEGDYCLYDNTGEYQYPNLVNEPGYDDIKQELREKIRHWMAISERHYTDRWFAKMPFKEVQRWNKEHDFGDTPNREVGKQALFEVL